jgi:hypothetical protein
MATIINASNSTGLTLTSDLSGVLQLQQNGVALPALSVAPAFYVYLSANQTGVTSATHTKVQLNTELFDTNNNFDPSTNYRFTPTVAGYYQISWGVNMSGTGLTYAIGEIYKNGTIYQYGNFNNVSAIEALSTGSSLVYMNGSTDYLELYAIATASSGTVTFTGVNSFRTFMSGCLVRGA